MGLNNTWKTTKWDVYEIEPSPENKWAMDMLDLISEKEWWEETGDKYFFEFFNTEIIWKNRN